MGLDAYVAVECNNQEDREDKMNDEEELMISDMIYQDLGFCGCGDPEAAIDLLIDVLTLMKRFHENEIPWKDYYDKREALLKADNEGLYWSYLYFLDHKSLIEHGTAVSSGWITQKGKDVLEDLKKYRKETYGEEE